MRPSRQPPRRQSEIPLSDGRIADLDFARLRADHHDLVQHNRIQRNDWMLLAHVAQHAMHDIGGFCALETQNNKLCQVRHPLELSVSCEGASTPTPLPKKRRPTLEALTTFGRSIGYEVASNCKPCVRTTRF